MKCPANFPQRHSIRRPGYDYSQPGAYFITLVTYQRQALLGEIMNGVMILNLLGQIAAEEWFKTSPLRPYVELSADEFVVMRNHVHGILHINADMAAPKRALRCYNPTAMNNTQEIFTLTELRDTLLPRLTSGSGRVK